MEVEVMSSNKSGLTKETAQILANASKTLGIIKPLSKKSK